MHPRIRDFTPEDYPALVDLYNTVYPEYPGTVEEKRHRDDRRDPKCRMRRWVAEQDGRLIGAGEYSQSADAYHPQHFSMGVAVLPEHQGRGIGRDLYNRVLDALAEFEPKELRGDVREDMIRGVRFVQDRGFVEEMRSWESRLDVRAFDPTPYADAERRVRDGRIEIRTLQELETDPDRNRKLFELDWELGEDVPHTWERTKPDFDRWIDRHLNNPNLLPDGYFLAVDGDRYVGISALWKSLTNDDLYQGLTGVHREYRRRGIALALKLRCIDFARRNGHGVIKTWNEINNRAMLSINERLGFVKQPAWMHLVCRL